MDAAKCLQILREIKDAAFATVDENGCPQVRIIDCMLVEEETLYFVTARGKDFYRELLSTRRVAVTALTKDFEMIRLNGTVKRPAPQKQWIDRIFEENPAMNGVYPGESRYVLEPFCIPCARIEYFDLGHTPIYRACFSTGGLTVPDKGYLITDRCVGCGLCKKACPQQCIEEGTPFLIRQNNCLHCGLCLETCPVGAVARKGGAAGVSDNAPQVGQDESAAQKEEGHAQ